ncbi:MAG: glucan biosynthesis protein G [Burkholderiales bacterium]|nr:MAG: glucan biosynthesis protein G [Burkholderiales bacterium]
MLSFFPLLQTGPGARWTLAVLTCLTCFSPLTQAMDWASLRELARTRASEPYVPTPDQLPDDLAALDYDGVRDIRFRPDRALWRDRQLPYEAQFFHLGLYQRKPVRIHEVGPQGVRKRPHQAADYDYGRNRLNTAAWGELGHAGFRLHYPLNNPAYKDELVVFLGASYFRALGAGQQYGLSARGLAIDTVGGQGEEFPRFTDFWLLQPDAQGTSVTVLALLDSPRATGAYRFEIRPGTSTVMGVSASVYLRTGQQPIARLALAPLTSMFLHGENQPSATDFRPEVHDSDGLLMHSGSGEWLWRPLQNPRQVSVSSFRMTNPRGFGLMQRDRRHTSYEDPEANYEKRPSAWVVPAGDWGAGHVELVQLPTPDETHDNIVAYWVPATLPPPGQPLDVSYELHWQGDQQQRPPGAWAAQTRQGHGYTRLTPAEQRLQPHFVVDFEGPSLKALPADATVRPVVTADANGQVVEALVYPYPAAGTWRLSLRVQRLDPSRPVELRAFLQTDQHTLSETWTHVILPD